MSDGGVQEIRSQLMEMRRLLVEAMADEQRLYQRQGEESREAERWRRRAELAIGRGADELAQAALGRSVDHSAMASRLMDQYQAQRNYVERMKARLRELESRPRVQTATPSRPMAQLERRIARWEQREERTPLAARSDLERDPLAEKLEALEREVRLERQLAELKQRLEGKPPLPEGEA